jgi:hypothetical protein
MDQLSNIIIQVVEDIENLPAPTVSGSFNEGFDFGFYN